jgi:hypothetical protein
MPKKPSVAQRKRATDLRKLIGAITSGKRTPDAPPQTPREITDAAARRKAKRSSRG